MKVDQIWSRFNKSFITDPYAYYREKREHASVFHSPSGDYVLLGYRDIRKILADKEFETGVRRQFVKRVAKHGEQKGKSFANIENIISGMLIQRNGSVHTKFRNILHKNWPKKDDVFRIITKRAAEVIQNIPDNSNWVLSISNKLTMAISCDFLGIDMVSKDIIDDCSELVYVLDPYLSVKDLKRLDEKATCVLKHFQSIYNDKSKSDEGLLARIKENEALFREVDVDPLSVAIFIFLATQDTTSYLISALSNELLMNRSLNLKEEEIPSFVNEMLRLHSPVQFVERLCPRDYQIDDVTIPKGSWMTLCIAAANRDPEIFSSPDEIDLSRSSGHLAFGHGNHRCLGTQVATVEAEVMVRNLLPIVGSYQRTGELEWHKRLTIRSIRTMNVARV